MEEYQRIGTINRTVLQQRPLWPTDWQALPPWGWCARCGAEVYRPREELCKRCARMDNGELRVEN